MEYQLSETLKLRFSADSVSVYELRAGGDPRWHLKAKFEWQLSVRQVVGKRNETPSGVFLDGELPEEYARMMDYPAQAEGKGE